MCYLFLSCWNLIFTIIDSFIEGLDDWGEDAVLHQVLAASQQEYLESLKKREDDTGDKKEAERDKAEDKDWVEKIKL